MTFLDLMLDYVENPKIAETWHPEILKCFQKGLDELELVLNGKIYEQRNRHSQNR